HNANHKEIATCFTGLKALFDGRLDDAQKRLETVARKADGGTDEYALAVYSLMRITPNYTPPRIAESTQRTVDTPEVRFK
ncbi:MAG: hypothetical protein ACRD3W_21695, partial [Terriglobales bacterium]